VFEVVPLQPDQWQVLKRLRLAALADAPDAFSPLLAEVVAQPDSYWRAWAGRLAAPERNIFVVRHEEDYVGLAGASVDEQGVGHVGAVWLDPAYRGRGASRALIGATCDFLDAAGATRTLLTATETSLAAIALYRSFGFELTGNAEPLRPGSHLSNLEMARPRPALPPAASPA
jgi:ribosomal protein S18 acetylase RimI-like enzyme